jgi:hypothetical protein
MYKILGDQALAKQHMPVLGMLQAHIVGALAAKGGKSRKRALAMEKVMREQLENTRSTPQTHGGRITWYSNLRPYHVEVTVHSNLLYV